MLSSLAHSSLEAHCSYRLKFFFCKNHLRSSSPSNCSLLCSLLGSHFARSYSPRPSQRSKYTEGVHCACAYVLLSTKVRPKKIRQGRTKFTTSGAHDVIAIKSPQKNDLCTKELRDRPNTLEDHLEKLDYIFKGVDKGGLGGLKPPPRFFWQTLYYGGAVMQKWVW